MSHAYVCARYIDTSLPKTTATTTTAASYPDRGGGYYLPRLISRTRETENVKRRESRVFSGLGDFARVPGKGMKNGCEVIDS